VGKRIWWCLFLACRNLFSLEELGMREAWLISSIEGIMVGGRPVLRGQRRKVFYSQFISLPGRKSFTVEELLEG